MVFLLFMSECLILFGLSEISIRLCHEIRRMADASMSKANGRPGPVMSYILPDKIHICLSFHQKRIEQTITEVSKSTNKQSYLSCSQQSVTLFCRQQTYLIDGSNHFSH